jgi:tripartite-type tricarboxylate transporter receptor subunit TctC
MMVFRGLLLAAVLLVPSFAAAQSYPDRPVKIVVPIGPAGSYDIVGRLLADQLSKRLGQSVVVENRPGAGTIVGTQAVINAPADGYTLLVGGLSNIVFNAGLYQKLPYDPLADLVPVALVFNISYTLVGRKDLPYATPREIIAAAKKSPGELKLANAGTGTGQHIVGAAFMKLTDTKLLEVPYRGSAAAFPDLLGGRVDLFFDSTPAALPYIKSGQAKGIGILTAKRNPQIPDVPTMRVRGRRSRDRFLDRAVRAGQDAARGHRTSAAGDRPGASGAQAAVRKQWRRAHGHAAGEAQGLRQGRVRQMDQDHPGRGNPPGLTRAGLRPS